MALPNYSQSEQETPTTYPQAGWQGLFFDSADSGKLKRIDDAGNVVDVEGTTGLLGLDDGGTGADLSSGQGVLVQATSGAVVSALGGTGVLKLTSDVPSVASLAAADLPTGTLKTDAAISSTLQNVEDGAGNTSALYASSTKVCVGAPLTSGIAAFSFGVFSGSGAYATTRCSTDDSECFFGTDGDPGRGIVGTLTAHELLIRTNNLSRINIGASGEIGFFGATAIAKPTVSGSRGGNAALASLLTALSNLGLVTNSTT
jgi:hypothetical protein